MAPTNGSKPKFAKKSVKQKAPAAKTRKELRKEQRKLKKLNRALYYQKKTGNAASAKNSAPDTARTQGVKENAGAQLESAEKKRLEEQRKLEAKRKLEERRARDAERRRIAQLSEANSQEDKEIKKLAKQLRLNKRKSKTTPQSFVNDGLDYILDFCNEDDRSRMLETEKHLLDEDMGAEFDEDFNMIMGIGKGKGGESKRGDDEDRDSEFSWWNNELSSEDSECDEKVKGTKSNIISRKNQKPSGDTDECVILSGEDSESDGKINTIKNSKKRKRGSDSHDAHRFVKMKKAISSDEETEESADETSADSSSASEYDARAAKKSRNIANNVNGHKYISNVNKKAKNAIQSPEVGKFVRIKKPEMDSSSKYESEEESDEGGDSYAFEGNSDENSDIPKSFEYSEDDSLLENSEPGKFVKIRKIESESDAEETQEEAHCSSTSEDENVQKSNASKDNKKSKNSLIFEEEESQTDQSDDDKDTEQNEKQTSDNEYWEDIYGRKRDKDGNVVQSTSKYVPPAARSTNSQNEDSRLRRQLKGLVNRLAEHNMHTISAQIEDLYMSNSRNAMNEVLTTLMLEALVSPVLTPDRMVAEHMMLIAILHANVGIEVGAHFLLTIVTRIDQGLKREQSVENKEMDNMILMLAHLYNFKIYGHKLLYQILNKIAEKFTEKEIELILLILRSVGFPLRKDDPAALKELILNLQEKASAVTTDSSRVKFMLDVLLAIKNNNMNKIPQYDPSHVDHLRKLLRSFLRKGNSVTQFNISLEDLLHADTRGKWWVVGSAWSGTEIDKKQDPSAKQMMFSQQMLELARKQRMNTDVRRNIFCVIMSAEDYLDAFEKLHRLGLKDQQERELIYVLMDCCLQEKTFNPYYAVLAQKFCEYERRFQLTIQYTLWDKLKTLDTFTDTQLSNLARFLMFLFVEKALCFSVLKVISFAELDRRTLRLLRQITLGILLHENVDTCASVFERVSVSPSLQQFREGLRLFISHFLMKNVESSEALSDKSELLKSRAQLVDKILVSRANKTIF